MESRQFKQNVSDMKKHISLLFKVTALLKLILLSGSAYSACNSMSPQTTSVSLGDILVRADTAIGTRIFTSTIPGVGVYSYGCSGNVSFGLLMTYTAKLSSYGQHVYDTPLAGVGIRVFNINSSGPTYESPHRLLYSSNSPASWTWDSGYMELIKTGPITSGTLPADTLAKVEMLGNDGIYHDAIFINTTGGSVKVPACSINTPNVPVPLDDVLATSLKLVGSTAKPKVFEIGLNCEANARITAKLSGTKNTDTNAVGVLQLANFGAAGVATGVGIQIIYNKSPLALNNSFTLKTSSGAQETFPFTAQYYQTKSNVTTGTANAIATLDLTYE